MFYLDWEKQMELLNDEQLRRFIYNLIRFHKDEEIIIESPLEQAIWNDVSRGLTINHEKYVKKVEANRENGRLGGRPRKNGNPAKPDGFSKNPENPITDNSKETTDNSEELNENSKKEIENSKKQIEKSEKVTVNRKLTKEEIEEFIDDRNKLKEYLDSRIEGIFIYNDEIQKEYTSNNIGKDIINNDKIESYISTISEIWNSNSGYSEKFRKLKDVKVGIASVLMNKLTYPILLLFNNQKFNEIDKKYLTENNIKLHQLYINLNDFYEDAIDISGKMNHSTL